jgi:hypothetical protein
MPVTAKKNTTKASTKTTGAKAHVAAAHPPWVEMIKVSEFLYILLLAV